MPNPRTPRQLKILKGTLQKCRDRDELELPFGVPDKPEWLNKFASEHWDYIVPKLEEYGLLTEIDITVLAQYCELHAEFRTTRTMPSAFPASKHAALRAACSDLGLSPVARTKIPGSGKNKEKKNVFAAKDKKKKGKAS